MDQVLDGKTPVKVVPFDAHDKVLRAPVEYKHQPYPKVVGYAAPVDDFAPKEPIVARDAKHEVELTKKKEK